MDFIRRITAWIYNTFVWLIRIGQWLNILIIVVSVVLYGLMTATLGGGPANQEAIWLDLALFYWGLLFWMFFLAQFVAPVSTSLQRVMIFWRLWGYFLGRHGPAIFVQNGQVRERTNERKRRGPGLMILDTASAAMLRTDVRFTRPVGPGLAFTTFDIRTGTTEYVATAFDLRRQSLFIGPQLSENAFEAQRANETPENYRERQSRRTQTSSLTRDGIEAVPSMVVVYQLDTRPGEGGTRYGYNPAVIWQAAAGEDVDSSLPRDDARSRLEWNWLPPYLAADVWRETIRKFTINQLFDMRPDFNPPLVNRPVTGVQAVLRHVTQRLTQPEVAELDANGALSGRHVPSREYNLLASRGIRVITVVLLNLQLPAAVDAQMESLWLSTWTIRSRDERMLMDRERTLRSISGGRQALRDYALSISRQLAAMPAGYRVSSTEMASKLAETSLRLTVRDVALGARAPLEREDLLQLVMWLRRRPE
ncbi:MAG TPA: hypothetical protein PKW33_07725 [Anaerolineaceae bacterium]|nr:hypothetical protein [Anaerolineaceae bacterium]HPN51461.1 hypothetical protein [Anaerolineaceae bacterium]